MLTFHNFLTLHSDESAKKWFCSVPLAHNVQEWIKKLICLNNVYRRELSNFPTDFLMDVSPIEINIVSFSEVKQGKNNVVLNCTNSVA